MNQRRLGALLAVAAAGLMSVPSGLAAQAASTPLAAAGGPGSPVTPIAQELRRTMDKLQFQQVLDLAPPGSAASKALPTGVNKNVVTPQQRTRIYATDTSSPQPIVQQPQVDATVLELDKAGRIISSGTVLMSPQYPHGIVVPVDQNFHTSDVRWRQWDDSGWYTNHAQGTIDVVPGRENAPIDFMLPYPASVLKLMVNFGVLRLVDSGEISLDDTYDYQPTLLTSLCGPATSGTIRGYIDASLTWSSNGASCALIKLLWDRGAIAGINQEFQDLGLETLQLEGTDPATGGGWTNAVTMSSLDTAKPPAGGHRPGHRRRLDQRRYHELAGHGQAAGAHQRRSGHPVDRPQRHAGDQRDPERVIPPDLQAGARPAGLELDALDAQLLRGRLSRAGHPSGHRAAVDRPRRHHDRRWQLLRPGRPALRPHRASDVRAQDRVGIELGRGRRHRCVVARQGVPPLHHRRVLQPR